MLLVLVTIPLRFQPPHAWKDPSPHTTQFVTVEKDVRLEVLGTVTLHVQIRADGIPAKISTSQGLPCGLTDKAIESVEHWRFKPATGPNGEPVAVEQTVEVTFRLY